MKTTPKKTLPAVRAAQDAVKDKTKKGKKPKRQVMVFLYEIRVGMEEYGNMKEYLDQAIEDIEGYGAVKLIDSGVVEGEV